MKGEVKIRSRDGWEGKRRKRLTAFKLHCTGLNVHGEILQVHRAGQDESQPEIDRMKDSRAAIGEGEKGHKAG